MLIFARSFRLSHRFGSFKAPILCQFETFLVERDELFASTTSFACLGEMKNWQAKSLYICEIKIEQKKSDWQSIETIFLNILVVSNLYFDFNFWASHAFPRLLVAWLKSTLPLFWAPLVGFVMLCMWSVQSATKCNGEMERLHGFAKMLFRMTLLF